MNTLKIELHLLQNFPPSCLNRDDTNTPKTCEFGGVTRARVSSQCWKRAIREQFMNQKQVATARRTLRLRSEILKNVNTSGWDGELLPYAVDIFITAYYTKTGGKESGDASTLVFIGKNEIAEAALCIDELREKLLAPAKVRLDAVKKKAEEKQNESGKAEKAAPGKSAKKEFSVDEKINDRLFLARHYTDLALFGRMIAVNPGLNVDAACQVAHAISTHSVNLELDFFTAVDDLKDTDNNDDSGAGMLGTVGYDSACYYRYALVDDVQLMKNLNGSATDADASLKAFLEAFCESIPGAKKNSFAHGNPPFFGFLVVRQSGTPSSLVNAFARPVNARNGNLLQDSARELARQAGRLDACYELYTDADKPNSVRTFLFHMLDVPEAQDGAKRENKRESAIETLLTGLPTQQNLSMRRAIEGVLETVKTFRAEQTGQEAQA